MVRIAALGDVILPEQVEQEWYELHPRLQASLDEADLVLANLEMPLTKRDDPRPKFCPLRADPGHAASLAAMGIDAVSLANNHALDHGAEALFDTIDALDEAGVGHAGAGADLVESLRPHRVDVAGRRIAFLSAASTLPGDSAAASNRPGVAPLNVATWYEHTEHAGETPGWPAVTRTDVSEEDVTALIRTVRSARRDADLVVLGLHWGVPTVPWLAEYQKPLAHRLVDAGVDVILGHHPHMLHGMEEYRGGIVLYSLGHFMCDARQVTRVLEMLTGWELGQWGLSGIFELEHGDTGWTVRLVPLVIDPQGRPLPADDTSIRRIADIVTEMSREFGMEAVPSGDVLVMGSADAHAGRPGSSPSV